MMSHEPEESTSPKLQLFSLPPTKSPHHFSGMITPPHHTASVPFSWEEEPGKPMPSKALSLPANSASKGLELPPRLLKGSKLTNTSPFLEGPYVGRSIFHSLRLTMCREASSDGDERRLVQADEKGGVSVSWRKTGFGLRQGKEEDVDEGSYHFCGLSGNGDGDGASTKKRSLLSLTKARFRFSESIYEAVKQVIPSPRRSSK